MRPVSEPRSTACGGATYRLVIIKNFTIVKFSVDIVPNLNDYRGDHRYGDTAIK